MDVLLKYDCQFAIEFELLATDLKAHPDGRLEMNISMVLGTDYLHPVLDGRVARQAGALNELGHKVTVICWARSVSGEPISAPEIEVVNNINVHRIFSPVSKPKEPLIKRIFQHIKAKSLLSSALDGIKSDVIHFHDLDTAVLSLLKEYSQPWIYDAHEDYAGMISHLPWPLPVLATFMEKILVRKSDAVITVSPSIMNRLASYGPKRRLMILNSRSSEHFSKKFISDDFRKEFGISPDKLLLLYIGSLGPGRSIMEAISAVDNSSNNHLLLGGHGMWSAKVNDAISNSKNVTFLGTVPSDQLPKYFSVSDIILGLRDPQVSDHAISMPNKFFEAAAAGRPLIASHGTLVGEMVSKHNIGVLAEYGNIDSLLKSLKGLEDSKIREGYGRAGINLVNGEFGWKWQARKLNLLYNNLVRK